MTLDDLERQNSFFWIFGDFFSPRECRHAEFSPWLGSAVEDQLPESVARCYM